MDTLFSEIELEARSSVAPLAVRMRPRTLDDFVGQTECVGPGSWLRTAIEQDALLDWTNAFYARHGRGNW